MTITPDTMPSPILVTISHTEPVWAYGEYGAAVERAAAAVYYLSNMQGLIPARRAKVKVASSANEHPMLLSCSLLCRTPYVAPAETDRCTDDTDCVAHLHVGGCPANITEPTA